MGPPAAETEEQGDDPTHAGDEAEDDPARAEGGVHCAPAFSDASFTRSGCSFS